ncbi:signal peptidase I [Arcanobacterium hippocoleae]|uniref:signal peptidase I n=1 Tax=Arcanobacterium hippocoleae TaxID=149017 RepID=UPI00333EDCD8
MNDQAAHRAQVAAADHLDAPAQAGEEALQSDSAADFTRLQENAKYPQQSKLKIFLSNVFEFFVIIVVALVIALVLKTFIVQPFEIPSSSMANTLVPGDRIVVNKLADTEDELKRGDIVVFVDPGDWLAGVSKPELNGLQEILHRAGETIGLLPQNAGTHLVKRLIGKPGDHVVCCTVNGNLTINGKEVPEPYLIAGARASDKPFDVTVPAGHLWMMGDNRPNSKDSRYHQEATGFGFVPIANVEGRAWLRAYPFNRFGWLKSQTEVFSEVPAAQDPKNAK